MQSIQLEKIEIYIYIQIENKKQLNFKTIMKKKEVRLLNNKKCLN